MRNGFTLIELLVAVTIMTVLTLAIARITSQTNDAIASNTRQAVENANARAALDLIARDFAQAIGDGRVKFRWDRSDFQTYNGQFECDKIRFAAYRHVFEGGSDASGPREAARILYKVEAVPSESSVYRLLRGEGDISANSYTNIWSGGDPVGIEVIRNVVEFRTDCRNAGGTRFTSGSEVSGIPVYVDVYLAILTDTESKRVKDLGVRDQSAQIAFIKRNAKRYHTRCYSLNRNAYEGGR